MTLGLCLLPFILYEFPKKKKEIKGHQRPNHFNPGLMDVQKNVHSLCIIDRRKFNRKLTLGISCHPFRQTKVRFQVKEAIL